MTALLTLRRPRQFRNCLSEYIVEIDGRRVGRLRARACQEFAVPPGHHEVRVRLDTIMAPKMGYVGSPAFEIDVDEGERSELDVIALPATYASFGVLQTTPDPEGWLMLAPAGTDKPPPRSPLAVIRGNWLRYTLSLVSLAAFIATLFVFRTGSAAWWDSNTVLLLSAGTLIYLRFGGPQRA